MIGRQLSHFYLIRVLGTGGMGTVYEAQDTRLPRSVAIKIIKDDLSRNVDAIRRFKREARLACSINHPNICTILEIGEHDGGSFIAMELLEGTTIKSRLLGEPLTLDEIVNIGVQAADALAAAHDNGIIHRDITPGNIFLTGGGLVKLLDFGLARHFPLSDGDERVTDELTSAGAIIGTIHYMAPEQLAEAPTVDYRCDLYALGAVLYQMATGARPFDIPSRHALSAAIQTQPHLPIRQLAPHHPAQLGQIIDRLLAKAPADRYQSAASLRDDLSALRRRQVTSASETVAADASSVAVLPFHVIGAGAPDSDAFADGLVAEISARVSRFPGVRVAPRTSIQALSGQSLRTIGQRLDVAAAIEGTVQRMAARVRVTATLVQVSSEKPVAPTLVVERPFDDPIAAQEEIARELCDGLTAMMTPVPATRRSADPEAYHAFKRGIHLWQSCFEGGWRHALEHFQHAIECDPEFAPAHVAIASAYNFLGFYSLLKPHLAFAAAERAARRALAIAPALGAAYIEVALSKFGGDWDWDGAEMAFREGIALEPGNPLARVHYSWLLVLLGRDEAALAEAERAHALAPASRLVAAARAQTMYIGGLCDQSIELCTLCLRLDPAYVFAVHLRGLCHLAKQMRAEAVADLEMAATLSHRAPFYLGLLGRCYGEFGMRREALQLIEELGRCGPDVYVPPQCYVFIYAGLGERERALEYQEQAYADGASPFNYLAPCIRSLYALSPHHRRRLEQMRLVL